MGKNISPVPNHNIALILIQPHSGGIFVARGRATKERHPGIKMGRVEPSARGSPKRRQFLFQTEKCNIGKRKTFIQKLPLFNLSNSIR